MRGLFPVGQRSWGRSGAACSGLQKTLEEDELRTARDHRRAPPDWTCLPSVSLLLSEELSLGRGSETPALSQRCKIAVAQEQDGRSQGRAAPPVYMYDVAHKGNMVASGLLQLGDNHEFKGRINPFHDPRVLELLCGCQMETQS